MKILNFKTILFSLIVVLFGTLFIAANKPKAPNKTPNIVVFFIDDLGYGDISVNGALGYKTPNLDKMAMEGTRFTNFLAAQPICTASRVGLLTGCYPNRVGMSGAIGPESKIGLNPNEETIAEIVKQKGYKTAIFGKWHLGSKKEFLPLQQGFDEFYGVPYSHDMWPLHPFQASAHYPDLYWIDGNENEKQLKDLDDVSTITPTITSKAIDFIKKNKKNPFFLYIPNPLPHVPLAASPRFKGKSGAGLFGDVIMELDWSVGEVLKELKKQGLDENTLVIFTADNGPWLNYGNHAGSTGGFREGKATSFEGGQREPCIMRWPGVVPAGRVSNKLLSTIDILPTIASLIGAKLPEKKIDGVNFADLLKGDDSKTPRETMLYYYRKNSLEAVRKHDWKLVFAHPGRTYEGHVPGIDGKPGSATENHEYPQALYDLSHDPGERYDVQSLHPEIMKELQKIAEEARKDLGDDLQNIEGTGKRPAGRVDS